MKHFESILFAAFVGAVLGYTYNQVWKFNEDNSRAVEVGAALGATMQIIMRVSGVS